jgi:hypothetical protein
MIRKLPRSSTAQGANDGKKLGELLDEFQGDVWMEFRQQAPAKAARP